MDDAGSFGPLTKFSGDWWDRFLENTADQQSPTVIMDCLSEDEQRSYTQSVLEILRLLGRLRTVKFGFRIYVEGRQYSLDEMWKMFDHMPLEGESLEAWAGRVFDGKRFGIIINTAEKFEPNLSANIAKKLVPLFNRVGVPRNGVNYTIFIGNYDRTPLGIHQDTRGESVMHFHLGPARKKMYLWSDSCYREMLAAGLSRDEPENMKSHAEIYDFGPGDVFFMPQGMWHIGEQEGLSVGLTVWQYNHTNSHIAASLHKFVGSQFFCKSDSRIAADASKLDSADGLTDILERNPIPVEYQSLTYEQILREMYIQWRHVLKSNAGYRGIHSVRTDNCQLVRGDIVQQVKPFELLVRAFPKYNRLQLYVRGHKLEFRFFSSVKKLADQLNTGERIAVSDLIDRVEGDLPENAALYILNEMVRHRGIDRIPNERI